MTDETAFSDIRVLGPYAFRGRWRCVIRNGSQKSFLSPEKTPARALAVAERLVAALCASVPMTVGSAIDRYQTHLREKGNKAASYEGTPLRLRRFFGRMLQSPLTSLSERRCQALYDDLRTECSPRTARPLAVDTHRAYLADARSFGRWVVKAKLLRDNPLAQIEGMGRRRRGKPQLRHDEAKAWLRKAQELADGEQPGAVAAMMCLLLGLRCGEIVNREVRDLDHGGSVLLIPDSKTEAGRRTVKVPDTLKRYLLTFSRNKQPKDLLLGKHDRDWPRHWVKKICRLARVPEVCAHSMRGLHATLAIEAGASPDVVARSLGHESASMTLSAYAAPGSAKAATATRVQNLFAGTTAPP